MKTSGHWSSGKKLVYKSERASGLFFAVKCVLTVERNEHRGG